MEPGADVPYLLRELASLLTDLRPTTREYEKFCERIAEIGIALGWENQTVKVGTPQDYFFMAPADAIAAAIKNGIRPQERGAFRAIEGPTRWFEPGNAWATIFRHIATMPRG